MIFSTELKFVTKGDYYLHCQECHPVSRPANVTSRIKYRIDSGLKKINPPEASGPQKNGEMHKTVSQSRYMLRTRKNSQFLKKYKEESEEDSDTSEVSEHASFSGGSSSDDSAQGSLAYGGKTEFLNVNKNDLEKCAETDSTETANSDNSLDREARNDFAVDSGFFDEFAVSSSTELADENSPIASIDWYTNFENYRNFQVTNELVDPTSQIDDVAGRTNLENIENVQLTNVLVPPNSQIGTIGWCTNFEDVETQPEQSNLVSENSQIDTIGWSRNIENVQDPQQRNELAEQTLKIVAIDWSPKLADVKNSPATNGAPDKDSKTPGAVFKNIASPEASQQKKNDGIDSKSELDTVDWYTSLKNIKTRETNNNLDEMDSKTKTIEWCQNLENFSNSPEKKLNFMDVNLPIKKRILRLIPKVESHRQATTIPGKLLVDRFHDELKREAKVELKTRKESRAAEQRNRNKKWRGTRDDKENVNPSPLLVEGKMKKEENQINYGSIEIHVDPRISFHNLTQAHREFFERLLTNQSLSDRINCM